MSRIILCLYLLISLALSGCRGNKALESRFAANPGLIPAKNTENEIILPFNFPIYPSITLNTVAGNKIMGVTPDATNIILGYYERELKRRDWIIEEKTENTIKARDEKQKVGVVLTAIARGGNTEFTLTYQTNQNNQTNQTTQTSQNNQNNQTSSETSNSGNNSINNIPTVKDNNPPKLDAALEELVRLQIIRDSQVNPYKIITRREYARWLVTVNNLLFKNSNGKIIRLANSNSKPVFNDVTQEDPDFGIIQGLAEAGIIPSSLTHQDGKYLNFYPDKPLTREDLIAWKTPLDFRQSLPNVTLDAIKNTWGFKDAEKINPQLWPLLYLDWQNGELSNVRKAFGYITIFQPQKPVTVEEAARVLSSFGIQTDVAYLKNVP
ncbi:MAG: S-layer homology domain-containing protein [Geminocystis sp.]|nr:S-layer homology domain-containing protein [Geminocystis sp.]HIK37199.1 S-layer homology domain-containing protein [Geminocystis sp. M7585_C2015_104]MCS7148410.1 S-layer homology domain-containing protein [Geminocystis sp.]MCX8078275.1 S-layer homology domain-containing protein [Geminocystis sp.]MDW8116002.1 S-layer homology domain-containing protein [Geminocystis sp.]